MPRQHIPHLWLLRLALGPVTAVTMATLLCVPATASVKVTPAANGYDIDIDGEASASELLDAIASATGAEIKGQPEDTTVPSNHLRNTSIERALRKLLPKAPFAVRFDTEDTPEVIIFLSPSQDASDEVEGAREDDSGPSEDSPAGDEQDIPAKNSDNGG